MVAMRLDGRERRRVARARAGAGIAGARSGFEGIGYLSPMLTKYAWPSSSLTPIRW